MVDPFLYLPFIYEERQLEWTSEAQPPVGNTPSVPFHLVVDCHDVLRQICRSSLSVLPSPILLIAIVLCSGIQDGL